MAMSWKELLIGTSWQRTIVRGLVMAVVTGIVFTQVFIPVSLQGESMEPTYLDGSWLLVNRWTYRFKEPQLGDVVAIKLAGPSVLFFKRIVGLAGDEISWQKGQLWRNGKPVTEEYVTLGCNWQSEPVKVGKAQVYVVGDNRSSVKSQHSHGIIDDYRLVGGPLW